MQSWECKKSPSKQTILICFTCSFFINIYNIAILFVFSSPHPKLYPIKNVSKTGCQVSIQIPFYLISLGEPSLKQRFTLKLGETNWRNSERNHLQPASLPSLEGKGSSSARSVMLSTTRKVAYDPEDIYSHPSLLERLRNFTTLYHLSWLLSWLALRWLTDWLGL